MGLDIKAGEIGYKPGDLPSLAELTLFRQLRPWRYAMDWHQNPEARIAKDGRVLCSSSKLQLRAEIAQPAMEESEKLQNETVTKLRTLAHDLSNSIETIMQASYLLAQAKLDENNGKWLDLIDKAAQDAARINRQIREILRSQG
jgi:signal transduction histidine kinase